MVEHVTTDLTITFDGCEYGWIRMMLIADGQSLTLRLSHLYDPLPDMLAWLEAIVIGVEECGFRIDEEGSFVRFSAHKQLRAMHSVNIVLNVTLEYNGQHLQATLQKHDLVRIFYHAIRDFSTSAAYVSEHWEHRTLENVLREQMGMTAAEWVDSAVALAPRQLQMALWRIDPSIIANPSEFAEDVGTEAELIELTGKTKAEAGGLPHYWPLPQELWGTYAKKNDQARCAYLEECLSYPMERSWNGTPWRKMRSMVVERWLDSEASIRDLFWKKWVVDDRR